MTQKEQEEHFNMFVCKMKTTILKKGEDYSNTDKLSNFKLSGPISGISPEQHCLALIAVKVARLGILLQPNSSAPNHESIEDSILDLANYALLLDMIRADK